MNLYKNLAWIAGLVCLGIVVVFVRPAMANPQPPDSDYDGMLDSWEQLHFGTLAKTATGDEDEDGLNNLQEYLLTTIPTNPDTDGDGNTDGVETVLGQNPKVNEGTAGVVHLEVFTPLE